MCESGEGGVLGWVEVSSCVHCVCTGEFVGHGVWRLAADNCV